MKLSTALILSLAVFLGGCAYLTTLWHDATAPISNIAQ